MNENEPRGMDSWELSRETLLELVVDLESLKTCQFVAPIWNHSHTLPLLHHLIHIVIQCIPHIELFLQGSTDEGLGLVFLYNLNRKEFL